MGVSNTCSPCVVSPSTLNRGKIVRRGINPSSGGVSATPCHKPPSPHALSHRKEALLFYYYFSYRTRLLIVAPPLAGQPDNSDISKDSRSTSASAYIIPPISLVSREKFKNYSDFSDFFRRWQTLSKASGKRCEAGGYLERV